MINQCRVDGEHRAADRQPYHVVSPLSIRSSRETLSRPSLFTISSSVVCPILYFSPSFVGSHMFAFVFLPFLSPLPHATPFHLSETIGNTRQSYYRGGWLDRIPYAKSKLTECEQSVDEKWTGEIEGEQMQMKLFVVSFQTAAAVNYDRLESCYTLFWTAIRRTYSVFIFNAIFHYFQNVSRLE